MEKAKTALTCQAADPFPLQAIVATIGNLPDYVIEYRHGIRCDFHEDTPAGRFFYLTRAAYRAVGMWLEYLLLNNTECVPELKLTSKVHYKPLAERSKAWLELAQQAWIHPQAQPNIVQAVQSPGMWWLSCEVHNLETKLANSGYLDTPKPIGKAALYRDTVETFKRLDNPIVSWQVTETNDPIFVLESEALRISERDGRFFEDYWIPYVKAIKRANRQIRDGKLSTLWLEKTRLRYG